MTVAASIREHQARGQPLVSGVESEAADGTDTVQAHERPCPLACHCEVVDSGEGNDWREVNEDTSIEAVRNERVSCHIKGDPGRTAPSTRIHVAPIGRKVTDLAEY